MSPIDPPLLLHCCCGPCATACVERLLAQGRRPRLYFSNSNLDTEAEFLKRLDNLRRVAAHFGLAEPLVDEYRHADWLRHVAAIPDYAQCPEGGNRCRQCFAWNLARAAEKAREIGGAFTTTLTVSPHKNSRVIFAVGAAHPAFEPIDFKKQDGFFRSTRLSRELGLYRQKYCGCEFSHQATNNQDSSPCPPTRNE